ncbi:Protein of unknown function [Gryllus bimaculatus]|nr:Protein of unknown function [Gryllus bimaculatus]
MAGRQSGALRSESGALSSTDSRPLLLQRFDALSRAEAAGFLARAVLNAPSTSLKADLEKLCITSPPGERIAFRQDSSGCAEQRTFGGARAVAAIYGVLRFYKLVRSGYWKRPDAYEL